jgi:hypothetical protein
MTNAVTVQFITVARDDLFALARRVFESVNHDVLRDPGNPLMVGVNGTMESGKKIIADAAVEYLFDKDTAVRDGICGRDEYWTGQRGGHPLEIDYIDTAYQDREDYSSRLQHKRLPQDCDLRETQRYGEKIYLFLRQRTEGGITFLQNAHTEMPQPGLSIFVEKSRGRIVKYTDARWLEAPLSVRYEFQSIANKNFWTRFVTMDVRDERLLGDQRFMNDLRAFSPFCLLTHRHSAAASNMNAAINIFGRDFPHPL